MPPSSSAQPAGARQSVRPALGQPKRCREILSAQQGEIFRQTDRQFAGLLVFQWIAGIVGAIVLSPAAGLPDHGTGAAHALSAALLGALVVSAPLFLAITQPGAALTRHAIAVGQMAMGALFIHLSGGRIEAHFQVFGSLAFLAVYRDWRVLVTATLVVAADHLLRGFFWPGSIFGLAEAAPGRTFEHLGWVLFTDVFLLVSIHRSQVDMTAVAQQRAALEQVNDEVETRIFARTAALKASQDHAREVLDSAYDAFLEVDPAGAILDWNERATELFGWTRTEVAGLRFEELIAAPAQRGRVQEAAARCLAGGDGLQPRRSHEFSGLRRDGGAFPAEMTLSSGQASGGRRLYIFIRDVSARNRQEEELQLLFDYMPAIVCFKDTENRILRANRQLAEVLGKPVAAIEGTSIRDHFPAESEKFYADDLAVIRSGEAKLGIEETFHDARGNLIWLETSKIPILDGSGRVTGLLVVARDITRRRQMDEDLRASERRFAGAFEHAPIGVALVSPAGRRLKVNRAYCEMLGYSETELLAGLIETVTHPDDRAADRDSLQKMLTGLHDTYRTEKRYLHAQGHVVTALLNVSLVRNVQGLPAYFIVQTQNITERKWAEQLLAESEAKLRLMADNITDVFWIFSADFQTLHYISKGYELLWGRPLAGLYANPQEWAEAILPEDRHRAFAAVAELTGSSPEISVEYRIARPDGAVRWVHARGFQVRDASGTLVRLTGTVSDITERKRGEESLRLLGAAMRQVQESIMITDAELALPGPRILFVNEAFTRMSGYSAAEVIGRTPRLSQGPRTDRAVIARLRSSLARDELFQGETVNYRKDGSFYDLEWQVAPIRNSQGVTTHYVAVQRDVTARKAAELELARVREAALESSRLKSRFLANMSHELRTPLNTINGLSATLTEQDLPLEARQAAALILQCGESLLENIQTILTHSSIEAGKTKLDEKPFTLADVVLQALRIAGEAAQRKGLELDCTIDEATPARLVGDPFRLQQILVNLLANSVKFTDRGRVQLRLRARLRPDGRTELGFTVADTGIGIAPAALARLFTPFAQADDSSTRRFEGTGLGLAITRSLVELMGGRIAVRSKPGAGSVFRFRIILPGVADCPGIFAEALRPDLAGRRILIEEPDARRRRQLLAIVAASGAVGVVSVATGSAGPVDCVLRRLPPGGAVATGGISPPVLWLAAAGRCSILPPDRRSDCLAAPFRAAELAAALALLIQGKMSGAAGGLDARPPTQKLGERLPLRILSADDTATNREVIKIMCRHLGYRTELAENGVEVLRQLETRAFDLILLDVQMPILDGISTAREICRRYPDPALRPRLIAVTASVQPGDRERCLEAGMDDYLSKPILPKVLAACIQRVFSTQSAPPTAVAGPVAGSGSTAPWIDEGYLQLTTEGLDPAGASGLIGSLRSSVQSDFLGVSPRLAAACAARQKDELIACVHGLKGCVLSVGWLRLGQLCTSTLSALRENRFADWDELPRELERQFAASSAEMDRLLAGPAKVPAVEPPTAGRSPKIRPIVIDL